MPRTYQILGRGVMGTRLNVRATQGLHFPSASLYRSSSGAELFGQRPNIHASLPTPGRSEVLSYHQGGGPHVLDPDTLAFKWGRAQKTKRPINQGPTATNRCHRPSTSTIPAAHGDGQSPLRCVAWGSGEAKYCQGISTGQKGMIPLCGNVFFE